MTYIVFDVLFLALVIGFAVAGVKRGFVKTFFGLFGFLIAIVIALLVAAPLANLLRDNLIRPALSSFFLRRLSEETAQNSAEIDFAALPAGGMALFERFGVTAEALAEKLIQTGRSMGQELAQELANLAVTRAAETLSHAVAFLALFTAASVAIAVVSRLLDLVAKVPGLHLSNRLLGLLAGIGEGVALAFVLARVLMLSEPALRGSGIAWLCDFSVEKTYLIRFLTLWDPFSLLKS